MVVGGIGRMRERGERREVLDGFSFSSLESVLELSGSSIGRVVVVVVLGGEERESLVAEEEVGEIGRAHV